MTHPLATDCRRFTVVYRVDDTSSSNILEVQATSPEHATEMLAEAIADSGVEEAYEVEHVIAHQVPRVILHVDHELLRASSDGAVELLEINDNKDAVAGALCDSGTPAVMPEYLTTEGERDVENCVTYRAHQAVFLPVPVAFGFEFLADAERAARYAKRCLGDGEADVEADSTGECPSMRYSREFLIKRLAEDYRNTVRTMAIEHDTSWLESLFREGWRGLNARSDQELFELAKAAGLLDPEDES